MRRQDLGRHVNSRASGFTIVELLIVIVVIGVLAALVITTFSGAQARARDARRDQDVHSIIKGLELFYADNGHFPHGGGSTTINSWWSTTGDASWDNLASELVPKYMSSLPRDPLTQGSPPLYNLHYSYFTYDGERCGAGPRQVFLFVFRYESKSQGPLSGSQPCTSGTQFNSTYASSYYISIH